MPRIVSTEVKLEFASQLKAWREANGKTQQELADLVGCSYSVVSKWEAAQKYPTVLYFKRQIKTVTGIDVDEIVRTHKEEV